MYASGDPYLLQQPVSTPENADIVLGYLSEFHEDGGTVVIVTHGAEAEQFADRIISLDAGRIRTES